MFVEPEALTPRLKGIQMVYPTLKKEWDRFNCDLEWKDFTSYQEKTIKHSNQGHEILYDEYFNAPIADSNASWSIAPLFFNHIPYTRNVEVLPKLSKTMRWLGETQYVGMARLKDNASLGWHYDPDPNPSTVRYRCQVPFDCTISILSVESEDRPQAEGKLLVFRSSAMHKVMNQGKNDRISLVFDVFREGKGRM